MMNDTQEQKRLQHLVDEAAKTFAHEVRQRAEKANDVAREHTAFLEKIALGSGGVMAAIVSFVGSKHDLRPSWLLRVTLIALAVNIMTVLVRNAVYPYYIGSLFQKRALKAEIDRHGAKAAFLYKFSAIDIDTGDWIDQAEYISTYQKNKPIADKKIKELEEAESSSFEWCKRLEKVCFTSTSLAALCLVVLVWMNF